jgi:predicted O-methyltransferase YrrM
MKMPTLSAVFSDVQKRCKKEGLAVFGGFSPFLTGSSRRAQFNFVARENTVLSTSGGIANDEAIFMYCLCEQIKPKKVLIIGNSYGFSTLFLSVSCPDATLVAFDKFRTEGIKTTIRLLEGLENKFVIQASTPEDIPAIIEKYFDGEVDFVLIDAVHTNEMQTKEFEVLDKYLSPQSVVVFHDVLSCNLLSSYNELRLKYTDHSFHLINKSSSGIAICIKGAIPEELKNFVDYYSFDANEIFHFNCLMLKEGNDSATGYNENVESKFKFPPHPQL